MRSFPFITVGKILRDLKRDGLPIARPTFYELERRGVFRASNRTDGSWRTYSEEEALWIKFNVWKNYKGLSSALEYAKQNNINLDNLPNTPTPADIPS